jgi:putative aminopeptidase FrvX
MAIPELLARLLAAPGPSGHEGAASAVWREAAGAFAEVTSDVMGSSFARVRGTGDASLVAIVGHIDEIGIVVTHVEDSGMLAFRSLGGFDPAVLVGQRVELLTRGGPLAGVIARRWRPAEERKENRGVELKQLHVDVGARDGDEARSLVTPGDPGVIAAAPVELAGDRIAARALDNRLGAYIALESARRLAESGGAGGDVVAVASVQEELELQGARAAAFALQPDVAIVVDVTPASDVPGGDPRETGKAELGSGPVIARGATLSPIVYDLLRSAAEAEGIATAIEVNTRATNTDADVILYSRMGVPTGLVSVPLRYVHSPVETAQLSDVEAVIGTIVSFVRRLEPGTSFVR